MGEQENRVGLAHTAGIGDTLDRILREVEIDSALSPPTAEEVGSTLDDTSPSAAVASGGMPPQGNPFGALLGGLAANPALLSAIPTLMENLGPLLGGGGMGKSGGGKGGGSPRSTFHSADRHTALLCAVKPYLGRERQEAAEKIIRLCRAWDALQKSGMADVLRGLAPAQSRDAHETKGKGGTDGYV